MEARASGHDGAAGGPVLPRSSSAQGTTLMTAICSFIVVLLIIQVWLVSAALEALLGDDLGVLVPAAIASVALFLVNGGLLLFALRYDRRTGRTGA